MWRGRTQRERRGTLRLGDGGLVNGAVAGGGEEQAASWLRRAVRSGRLALVRHRRTAAFKRHESE